MKRWEIPIILFLFGFLIGVLVGIQLIERCETITALCAIFIALLA